MRRAWTLIGVLLLVVVTAYIASANGKEAASGPLTGHWECVAHSIVEGDVPFSLDLKQNREDVTGKFTNASGEVPLTSTSYKKGVLEIHLVAPDGSYAATGKLVHGQLSGHWSKRQEAEGGWDCRKSAPGKQ
jgi:flagellar hook assembly protein FlgD